MSRRWDVRSQVVTPEAVALEFQEANVGSRAVAILVDFTILGLAVWLLNVAIGFLLDRSTGVVPGWVAATVLLIINFVLIFGYPLAFETLAHGKTPGKSVMGLRVVTVEGSPVRFRHAAIRSAFWLVDFGLFGLGALLATSLSKRHQRLGDMVAGTVVLRERSAAPAPRAASFEVPPGAEQYAATIDPSRLTTRDYAAVREFLLRSPDLDVHKREEIGRRLAAALGPRVGHDVPPEESLRFLICLAARYQSRATPAAPADEPIRREQDRAATPDPSPPQAGGDFAPPR